MTMGTIGKVMKATRTQMIEAATELESEKFARHFVMKDGDYIRYSKDGEDFKQARIMEVEKVYWNQAGGWTAWITIAPLLTTGKLGKTRSLTIAVNANGSGLKGIGTYECVQRVTSSVGRFV